MCKSSIWHPKYIFSRNTGFLEGLCRAPHKVFGLSVGFPSPWATVTLKTTEAQRHVQLKLSGLHTADVMELMFAEWEDGERFSFEDSDRFEEDSLCSFISEAESLCQNWRGWRKQSAGPNSPTVKIKGNGRLSSCAVIVMWAHHALAWLHLSPQVVLLTYGQQCHVDKLVNYVLEGYLFWYKLHLGKLYIYIYLYYSLYDLMV